ncbi:MAG TPA: ATP-binding protein [Deltaproteobacteria bacterium]|nr:ATP-binding protein [Deltaproteobacteria bacterium]
MEKRVLRKTGTAVSDYRMIGHGDRILVAVSGGKDSIVLLKVLYELNRSAPVEFELVPVHVATGFEKDFHRIQDWALEELGVTIRVFQSGIGEILEKVADPEKSPCALCSRLRRGVLYTMAHEEGFTAIALGHHLDDIVETFLLRCFYTGQIGAMAPSRYSDDGRNRVIRPLAYCRGDLVQGYFDTLRIAPVRNECPRKPDGKREWVRNRLSELEKEHPFIKESVFSALSNIDMKSLCLREERRAHPH